MSVNLAHRPHKKENGPSHVARAVF